MIVGGANGRKVGILEGDLLGDRVGDVDGLLVLAMVGLLDAIPTTGAPDALDGDDEGSDVVGLEDEGASDGEYVGIVVGLEVMF
jgi:hypothetical protein